MPEDYTVTGTTVQEVPHIPPLGSPVRFTVVRYMVGQHGPFQDEYPTAEYTPAKAAAGIAARVHGLRQLYEALPKG